MTSIYVPSANDPLAAHAVINLNLSSFRHHWALVARGGYEGLSSSRVSASVGRSAVAVVPLCGSLYGPTVRATGISGAAVAGPSVPTTPISNFPDWYSLVSVEGWDSNLSS